MGLIDFYGGKEGSIPRGIHMDGYKWMMIGGMLGPTH